MPVEINVERNCVMRFGSWKKLWTTLPRYLHHTRYDMCVCVYVRKQNRFVRQLLIVRSSCRAHASSAIDFFRRTEKQSLDDVRASSTRYFTAWSSILWMILAERVETLRVDGTLNRLGAMIDKLCYLLYMLIQGISYNCNFLIETNWVMLGKLFLGIDCCIRNVKIWNVP